MASAVGHGDRNGWSRRVGTLPRRRGGHGSDVTESELEAPLHPAFSRMSTHLITLAEEMLRTLRQPIGGDSDAAADLRDTSLDVEWGRPLFQYVHRSAPLVISVHDHIRATGALILADRVVQAPMTVMRSALEGLSLMYWLYEPGIEALRGSW